MEENALMYEAEPEFTGDGGELYPSGDAKFRPLRYNAELLGRMENPSGYGKVTGTCGRTVEIYLQIRKKSIHNAMFFTNGCLTTKRCCSAVAELSRGLSLNKAALIGGDTILDAVRGVPRGKVHCAFLATEALHAAINNWLGRLTSGGRDIRLSSRECRSSFIGIMPGH